MAPIIDENSAPVENVMQVPALTKDVLKPVVSKPGVPLRASKRKVCTDLLAEFDAADVPLVSSATADEVFVDSSELSSTGACKKAKLTDLEPCKLADALDADVTKLSFDSLEAYKQCLGSCEIPLVDACAQEGAESSEWTDSTTGVVLGYAVCDRDDLDELGVDDTCEEAHASDIKWKDAASGTVMGFSLFEAEDDVPAYVQETTEEVEWEDPNTGVVLGYSACADEALLDLVDDMEKVDAPTIALTMDSAEWHDAKTGVLMAYAECEDKELEFFASASKDAELYADEHAAPSEEYWLTPPNEDEEGCAEEAHDTLLSYEEVAFHDAVDEDAEVEQCSHPQITLEWQDDATAAMLGYSLCDESDEDLQVALALFEDTDDVAAHVEGTEDSDEHSGSDESENSGSDEATSDSGNGTTVSSLAACDTEIVLGYGALQQVAS